LFDDVLDPHRARGQVVRLGRDRAMDQLEPLVERLLRLEAQALDDPRMPRAIRRRPCEERDTEVTRAWVNAAPHGAFVHGSLARSVALCTQSRTLRSSKGSPSQHSTKSWPTTMCAPPMRSHFSISSRRISSV